MTTTNLAFTLSEVLAHAAMEALAARGQHDPSDALIDAVVAVGDRNGTPQAVIEEYERVAGPDIGMDVVRAFLEVRANELLARDVAELAIELGWGS